MDSFVLKRYLQMTCQSLVCPGNLFDSYQSKPRAHISECWFSAEPCHHHLLVGWHSQGLWTVQSQLFLAHRKSQEWLNILTWCYSYVLRIIEWYWITVHWTRENCISWSLSLQDLESKMSTEEHSIFCADHRPTSFPQWASSFYDVHPGPILAGLFNNTS